VFYLGAKSRGSITMRMLMGANEIYVDGKAQPIEEQTNKRSVSPDDKCEKIDYLIRDGLEAKCPPSIKRDGKIENFIIPFSYSLF
jgi:hypothetical protein